MARIVKPTTSVSEKRVLDYIEQHFNLSCFEVLDFPLMPGGKILRDKNGDELLFYHDILTDTVKFKEPSN